MRKGRRSAIPSPTPSIACRWGNKWGNMPHRFQPISADLDFVKTALDRAPHSPAGPQARAHNPKVAGSNPAPAIGRKPCKSGVLAQTTGRKMASGATPGATRGPREVDPALEIGPPVHQRS